MLLISTAIWKQKAKNDAVAGGEAARQGSSDRYNIIKDKRNNTTTEKEYRIFNHHRSLKLLRKKQVCNSNGQINGHWSFNSIIEQFLLDVVTNVSAGRNGLEGIQHSVSSLGVWLFEVAIIKILD